MTSIEDSRGVATAKQRGVGAERVAPWILLLLFAAVACATVLRHEMWRDEIHAWQATVAADTPIELAHNVRHEGHPGLWFAMLYPVSRLTTDPAAMQALHLVVAVAAAGLVLLASPFPLGWRALVVFGYYPLYEYCAISRNYAIGALLIFLFCTLYSYRARHPLLLAGVLFLLAQASVYTLILSFAMGAMWIADELSGSRGRLRAVGRGTGWALAVWFLGLLLSAVQVSGARAVKHPFDPDKVTETSRVLDVLATPWRGSVPLPRPHFRFWNTNVLDIVPAGDVLQVILGLALVVAFAVLFRRRPPVLVAYLVGTTALVAFAFLIYVGHLRHHGHHLLLLLACLWIWFCAPDQKVRRLPRAASLLIAGLLAANLVAGLYAVARDARDPFSAGRAVARFIRSNAPGDVTVVGHRDVQVATVTGYLQRPVYYPSMGREAIFVGHGSTSRTAIDDEETMRQARARAEQQGRDVIVVLSRSGRRRPKSLAGAAKVGDFSVSIVASERYEVYRMPAAAGRNLRGP